MTMMLLFSLVLSGSFILPLVSEPLSMGCLILFNSLIMSVCIFFEGGSWFGFILFLIYIGGLLVMFAYVTALTPNLIFKQGYLKISFCLMYFLWVTVFLQSEVVGVMYSLEKLDFPIMVEYHKLGASLFSFFSFMSIVGLALILLFVLLCVVKICYKGGGALRPFK
uniref:NADH dehydrogenase subunit 6 n=1 Tax=Enoplochiton echinatus TaxID=3244015 RepID=A0A6H1PGF9_9MOLL|nr:NADH dehydrogenase subunit 6 [Acanthopleura echinata]